ncbi:MAG: hypothetical protein L0287_15260 [Anaerolineae bacterium]|nr:hypothetical protein [Anaerolineae bacterium]
MNVVRLKMIGALLAMLVIASPVEAEDRYHRHGGGGHHRGHHGGGHHRGHHGGGHHIVDHFFFGGHGYHDGYRHYYPSYGGYAPYRWPYSRPYRYYQPEPEVYVVPETRYVPVPQYVPAPQPVAPVQPITPVTFAYVMNFGQSGVPHQVVDVGVDGSIITPTSLGLQHGNAVWCRTYHVNSGPNMYRACRQADGSWR